MMKSRLNLFFLGIVTLLCLLPGMSVAQNLAVSGVVNNEQGEPLVGVAVMVQGTNTVAITDGDGRFSLPRVSQGSILVFQLLGYTTQEIEASATMEVAMQPDNLQVEEIVVIGYGQQRRVTLTGAVASVGSKELLKSPAASLGNSLAGRLPGVQSVQYSGMPGADAPLIQIRGVGTLNSASPLVLVDGVERSFTQLDPNEVADVSILKDASATAVFGVRGANGVILVTTKRGQSGKTAVSFSAQGGIQQITEYLTPANSWEYATAFNLAQVTDNPEDFDPSKLKYSQEALYHFAAGDMPMVYPSTDWFDYLMKDMAWQHQYNVNVSGGNDTAKFFVSVGAFNQDGLFETFNQGKDANFKYARYNYRVNLDLNLSKRSTLNLGVGGRLSTRNSIGGGEGGSDGGDGGLFANQGLLNSGLPMSGYGIDSEGRRIVSDPTLVGSYGGDALGRLYQLGYTKITNNTLNLDLQYQLKMDFITEGLDFRIKGSYNSEYTQTKDREHGFGSGVSYMATIIPNEFESDMVTPKMTLVKRGDAFPLPYEERRGGGRNWYMEAGFNYARKFGNHNVGGLILYNQSKTYYPWDSQNLYRSIPRGYVGLVGRVTYDYDTRYMLDLNVGYNGSENFAEGKRFGLFPSASVGWIASSERFWEPIKNVITYLKLRASVGLVGNDSTNNLRFLYRPGLYRYLGGGSGGGFYPDRTANFGIGNTTFVPGAREEGQGNPNVTWETALKQNFGIDLAFLNSRLTASFDYFMEDRKDILQRNDNIISGVTGLQATSINYGRVKNHGYEITLKWADQVGDFSYSIAPSLTYARNKLVRSAEGVREYDYLYRVGHPVGQPFGRILFEYYEAGATEERYRAKYGYDIEDNGGMSRFQNTTIREGDAIYVDLNNDGVVDSYDEMAIGYTDVPEYTASVNMSFGWKGFDLSMLWIGATNSSRMLGAYYRPVFGTGDQSMMNKWVYDNSWTAEHRDRKLPRITLANKAHNHQTASDIWLIDASYIRLKNAEIGYTFRIPQIPQIGNIRVYASGYNLLTFSKFKGNDPEARQGVWGTFIKYPLTRIYNFGVNVNF